MSNIRIKDLNNISINEAVLSSQIPIDSEDGGTKGIYLSSITSLSNVISDGKYLPLSGGVMIPALSRSSQYPNQKYCYIQTQGTSGAISLQSANEVSAGARLDLFGKDSSEATGHFGLHCPGGTTGLIGTPSGILTWNGKSVVRSVLGCNADEYGNVVFCSGSNLTSSSFMDTLGKSETKEIYHNDSGETVIVNFLIYSCDTSWVGSVECHITTNDSSSYDTIPDRDDSYIYAHSFTYIVKPGCGISLTNPSRRYSIQIDCCLNVRKTHV